MAGLYEGQNYTLSDICYEHIKDTFYHGLFGDFKLVIDKATGYFNATKLCIEGGKRFRDWKVLENSKRMVEYYQENWRQDSRANFLYEIKDANKDQIGKQVTGTYVPKELILNIASWVSIEFYDKCNKVIIDYFLTEFKKMDKTNLEEKIKQVQDQMTQMTLENNQMALENKDLKEELEDTKEYSLILQEMMVKDDPITRTQIIYIATTELYAKTNNFKAGGTDDDKKLKPRLSTYNTGRVMEDHFYYSDIFMVSNYHLIEAQLKNLLGRFRNKKEKEMYHLHYNDIKYIVEYLCKRDGEDVDEVNSNLTQFITNLNKRVLRPVVPPPNMSYLTSVTHLKEDGTVIQTTMQSDSFENAVKEYILTLKPSVTSISKKKVFDDLKVRKDRTKEFPILINIFGQLKPGIKILKKS